MTTGDWMVQNSSLDVALAWEHLVNPECTGGDGGDIFIKSYKIIREIPVTSIYINKPTYKVILPEISYKVIYKPNPTVVTRLVENTIITKGC